MLHRFRIVFARYWHDDTEYFEERRRVSQSAKLMTLTEAVIAQLAAEIDQNETFAGRFRFSKCVSLCNDIYYCLGEVEYEGPDDECVAFDKFMDEFQVCYDDYGMAGHYQIVPFDHQAGLKARKLAPEADMLPYIPPWIAD